MRLDHERNWAHTNRYGVDQMSAIGGWIKRCMHWVVRGAVFRCDKATYVEMIFISCTEEEIYARRVVPIINGNLILADDAPVTNSLDYVAFTRPCETIDFVSNFHYWLKEIVLSKSFVSGQGPKLFVNCHCVDIFEILTRQPGELFVQDRSWWSSYEGSCLSFASTLVVFTYHSSLVLLTECCSLLFCIGVTKHSVYALMSLFSSTFPGGTGDTTPDIESVTSLVGSGVLFFCRLVSTHLYQMSVVLSPSRYSVRTGVDISGISSESRDRLGL